MCDAGLATLRYTVLLATKAMDIATMRVILRNSVS